MRNRPITGVLFYHKAQTGQLTNENVTIGVVTNQNRPLDDHEMVNLA